MCTLLSLKILHVLLIKFVRVVLSVITLFHATDFCKIIFLFFHMRVHLLRLDSYRTALSSAEWSLDKPTIQLRQSARVNNVINWLGLATRAQITWSNENYFWGLVLAGTNNTSMHNFSVCICSKMSVVLICFARMASLTCVTWTVSVSSRHRRNTTTTAPRFSGTSSDGVFLFSGWRLHRWPGKRQFVP